MSEDCDFVLLINNDTVFEEKLLQKLIDAHHQYGSSIITPKMMYHEPNNVIWYAGGFFDRKKAWLNYHRGQNEVDKGQFQENDVIEYAPTCCAFIHRAVFDDVGLMDEKYLCILMIRISFIVLLKMANMRLDILTMCYSITR